MTKMYGGFIVFKRFYLSSVITHHHDMDGPRKPLHLNINESESVVLSLVVNYYIVTLTYF